MTEHPEITYIGCARCGTQIAGLDGRYACSGCGWVNEWTEGHRPLPGSRSGRSGDVSVPGPGIAVPAAHHVHSPPLRRLAGLSAPDQTGKSA